MRLSMFIVGWIVLSIARPGWAEGELSRMDGLADIAEAFETIESVHPNPYTIAAREDVERARARLESALPNELDRTRLFLGLAPIIASLRDGHTSLRLPMNDFETRFGGSAFPIDVTFVGDSLFVENDFSGHLPSGTELSRIGGLDVANLVAKLEPFQHAELPPARRQNIAKYFPAYLALVLNVRSPFDIRYRLPNQTTADSEVGRLPLKQIPGLALTEMAKQRAMDGPTPQYSYASIPGTDLGLLSYHACAPGPRFDLFLRNTFARIQREKPAALVIDIRTNGGGSARANVALFDYITDKPYRMVSGGDLKVSNLVKQKLGREAFESRFASWETPDGTLLSESNIAPRTPGKNPLRYTGPVYVLTGVGTRSSALNFAAAVKDHQLATIVGQETGDPATAFGDLEVFRLKRSGLELYVSTKFFIRPNGSRKRRGILPDFEIEPSLPAGPSHRDRAIEFIKRHSNLRSR